MAREKDFNAQFQEKLSQFTFFEIEEKFLSANVPFSKINDVAGVIDEPQTKALGMIVQDEENKTHVDFPAFIKGYPNVKPTKARAIGADTESVLRDICGYDRAKIEAVLGEI